MITGVGSLSLLQGIFPTQGLNPGLPHCRQILYQLSHKRSPKRKCVYEYWSGKCWRRLLRVPWNARRSNQSILNEISPEYSLEGRMLKLKSNTLAMWCEEPTHLRRPWSGKDWRQEEKGTIEDEMDEWHHQVKGHEFWQVTEDVKDREAWHVVVHGVTKNWTWVTE